IKGLLNFINKRSDRELFHSS
ncbi:hypothetical protein CP082626L3_0675B, partial [Chlamydia psittaci 08-2626_L3]